MCNFATICAQYIDTCKQISTAQSILLYHLIGQKCAVLKLYTYINITKPKLKSKNNYISKKKFKALKNVNRHSNRNKNHKTLKSNSKPKPNENNSIN